MHYAVMSNEVRGNDRVEANNPLDAVRRVALESIGQTVMLGGHDARITRVRSVEWHDGIYNHYRTPASGGYRVVLGTDMRADHPLGGERELVAHMIVRCVESSEAHLVPSAVDATDEMERLFATMRHLI